MESFSMGLRKRGAVKSHRPLWWITGALILVLGLGAGKILNAQEPATQAAPLAPLDQTYLQDEAGIVNADIAKQIVEACRQIEAEMRIRVLIRTETLPDLSVYPQCVESFFSDWIRSIGLDKRGILLYAGLPKDGLHGKFNLRVGIGLKYLITKEMGERILNRVILPNNAADKDGRGFLEGVLTIKRMLLDELKRETQRKGLPGGTFSLGRFLWASKEILLAFAVGLFLCYIVFFIERCPRCNGALHVRFETLKEPGPSTLGLRRKIFACERCGFSRRKKEPIYPPGKAGIVMWLTGARRNVRIPPTPGPSQDPSAAPSEEGGQSTED